MPSHRTPSITLLLAVAGAAALIALIMNRGMQPQTGRSGREGQGARREGQAQGQAEAQAPCFAAVSPAAAAEAGEVSAAEFVRPAGPESMRDTPRRGWDKTDEASDESFPASDPPATY